MLDHNLDYIDRKTKQQTYQLVCGINKLDMKTLQAIYQI
jgi:hypothetical protein